MDYLFTNLSDSAEGDYRAFVASHEASDWIIAADFCMDLVGKAHDAFAFTIFPVLGPLDRLFHDLTAALPKDMKRTKKPSPELLLYLRAGPLFSTYS